MARCMEAVEKLGGRREDVLRARMFVAVSLPIISTSRRYSSLSNSGQPSTEAKAISVSSYPLFILLILALTHILISENTTDSVHLLHQNNSDTAAVGNAFRQTFSSQAASMDSITPTTTTTSEIGAAATMIFVPGASLIRGFWWRLKST